MNNEIYASVGIVLIVAVALGVFATLVALVAQLGETLWGLSIL